MHKKLDAVYRSEGRIVFASLVRMVSDFELAEEALHEAFAAALEQWVKDGIPENPKAWLISCGRFKAIDVIRRRNRFEKSIPELSLTMDQEVTIEDWDESRFKDDHLRLIFTCCHPALAPSTQVALTLREVCGITTEEIAEAFLTTAPTMAQRIVRGKSKIKLAKIRYEIPSVKELPDRLDSVLSVIYLEFNEGYSASFGDVLTRPNLSQEAIRLGRLLAELLPDAEVLGLLALMLLNESRREARSSRDGYIILLENQDRSLWNASLIAEGKALVESALRSGQGGAYTVQAAISAVHSDTHFVEGTDWGQIIALYDLLLSGMESPVVELNRAVAVAMRDGPEVGLRLMNAILDRGELTRYHLAYAAKADMCRRLARNDEAKAAYSMAITFSRQEPERRFLEKRLKALD
ncbi:MAG: RNA polymerase sigma factor [Oligoflexus sp.]|nr:RNA polymerase sigma factor [Oligoflexus sp.]